MEEIRKRQTTVYYPIKTVLGWEVDFERNGKIVMTEIFDNRLKAIEFWKNNC